MGNKRIRLERRQAGQVVQIASSAAPLAGTPVFALAVFVGAFLLFQIQPIMGKFVLPRFGGGSEVWITCLLFFQLLLVAGYAYAHLLVSRLSRRAQAGLHLSLLAAAAVAVPLGMRMMQRAPSTGGEDPTAAILALLAVTVGLPYVILSATGPLVQGWFAQTWPGRSPYRLYAMSNAGSLLALLSYPVLIEPLLSRRGQMVVWWAGLGVFVVLAGLCARRLAGAKPADPSGPPPNDAPPSHSSSSRHPPATEAKSGANPQAPKSHADQRPSTDARAASERRGVWVLWLLLPGVAVVELMSVTTNITQDVAPIPLLWIVPLSLYLVSFIVCFDRPGLSSRRVWLLVFCFSAVVVTQLRQVQMQWPILVEIAVYCLMMFSCCMICHGELYRLRPPPRRLTGYYLLIAIGGALGGLFVAVAAPRLFSVCMETELGMGAALALLVVIAWKRRLRTRLVAAAVLMVGVVIGLLVGYSRASNEWSHLATRTRNFYGVLYVWNYQPRDPLKRARWLSHGTTQHGMQLTDPSVRSLPTTYYVPSSGAGRAMRMLQQRGPVNVGVVGLGAGTLATYIRPQDRIAFYEINPRVERIARKYFSYLGDCRGPCQVYIGDGRLVLESQADQNYDLLVLDAFNSDSIPLHLLTVEAMRVYLRHLGTDGVLAFHVSSQNLNLDRVLAELADHLDLTAALLDDPARDQPLALPSSWVLLSRVEDFPANEFLASVSQRLYPRPGQALWSDDYVNVLQVFNPRGNWSWGPPQGSSANR